MHNNNSNRRMMGRHWDIATRRRPRIRIITQYHHRIHGNNMLRRRFLDGNMPVGSTRRPLWWQARRME